MMVRAEAKKLRLQGYGWEHIAARLGITIAALTWVRRGSGDEVLRNGAPSPLWKHYWHTDVDALILDPPANTSLAQLAKLFHTTKNSLSGRRWRLLQQKRKTPPHDPKACKSTKT